MKILLATSKATPTGGGIASYNQELVKTLGLENEIHLLTDADEENIEGYASTISNFGKKNTDYSYCKKLIEKLNVSDFDIIINSASIFIPVIAPYLNAKLISISHFVDGKLAFNAGFNSHYVSGIVALSYYGKHHFISKYNIEDEKIAVIYNFVRLTNAPNYDKIDNRPIRIIYPGGTSIAKSSDIIQRLVYRLNASYLDFEFIWMGGTRLPSSRLSIFGLHDVNDLVKGDDRVKIVGKVSRQEAMNLMATANIFVLPSRGEGCPMTLLEAMGAGCIPIVSDAHHGSREILESAKVGFIVKQDSSKELFHAIKNILQQPEKYVQQYQMSYSYMSSNLSQENWKRKMTDLMVKCLGGYKEISPLSKRKFKYDALRFNMRYKYEDFKLLIRSISYRPKFDLSYLLNKLSIYGNHR